MGSRTTRRSEVERVFDIQLAESSRMSDAIDLWRRMYENTPIWAVDYEAIGLPAAIAGEIARLTTSELETKVTGSEMADFIDGTYQQTIKKAREYTEKACAFGGLFLKPFYSPVNGRIEVSTIVAGEAFPTKFDSNGDIKGAIFADQIVKGDYCFTRLERHELVGTTYGIENKVFCKHMLDISDDYSLGDECLLTDVEEWAGIKPIVVIMNITKPLFAYFKMPIANNIEQNSPIGVSVYGKAWHLIRRADKQWSKICWEYDATEAAIHADEDMFVTTRSGELDMEKNKRRLYRTLEGFKNQINEYSPAIRDASLFNGLEQILRQIEFQCNLSYGTISNPNEIEKTAEEFKSSKHRSVSFIGDVQEAFKKAHEDLIEAIRELAIMYGLCQDGLYETMFNFDDTMAINRSEAFRELMQLASAGLIKPEYVTSWYFGVSEEEALKMMPAPYDDEEKAPEEE